MLSEDALQVSSDSLFASNVMDVSSCYSKAPLGYRQTTSTRAARVDGREIGGKGRVA